MTLPFHEAESVPDTTEQPPPLPGLLIAGAPFQTGELSALQAEGAARNILPGIWAAWWLRDSPEVRAEAAQAALQTHPFLALGGLTAAWVHGCARAPRRLEVCVARFQRPRRPAPDRMPVRCIEERLAAEDIEQWGRTPVLSPARLAYDLLWLDAPHEACVRALRRLLSRPQLKVDGEAVSALLAASERRPGKREAEARLRETQALVLGTMRDR